jgi:Imidazoleglycerol-phosphate dehydratase
VGEFDTELAEEFFSALVREAGLTLHIKLLAGKNTHHIIEAVFKAFGRVLGAGVKVISDQIPSTKGVI